jgi:uncharacterized SAM-binding protein YcdF (DUF218 family)
MQKHLFEKLHQVSGILLLVLAPINGWMAYTLYRQHPIMASANAAAAVVIVPGVIFFWRAGRRG